MTHFRRQMREIFYAGLIVFVLALIVFSQFQKESSRIKLHRLDDEAGSKTFESSFPGLYQDKQNQTLAEKLEVFRDPEQLRQVIAANPVPYLGLIILGILAIGLLVISIPALVIYLIARFKGQDPLITEPRPGDIKWTLGDVIKSIAVFMLFVFFIQSVITAVLTIAPERVESISSRQLDFYLGSQIIIEFLVVCFCIYLVVEMRGGSLAQLGLTFRHFFKNIFRGLSGYVIAAPALAVMIIISRWLVDKFSEPPDTKIMMEFLAPQYGFRHVLLGFLMIAVIGPVVEEIFFRGFLQGALRRRFSFWPAIIISSLFFALVHFRWVALPFLFPFGILLGYLYEKTQSLVPTITVHIVHNSFIAFYIIFLLLL